VILEDSRIDQYPKVVKGESKVVYEWQGTNMVSSVSGLQSTGLFKHCWTFIVISASTHLVTCDT
jgi:hypothetical protein